MLYTESSKIIETGRTTYTTTTFKVIDKEIGRFTVYGQTEIEDFRFKTHLNNIGKNISILVHGISKGAAKFNFWREFKIFKVNI